MFSRSITTKTARNRVYEAAVDVAVVIDNIPVSPGDLVIGDGTGVVFVPAARAEEIILLAERIAAKENRMIDALHDGQSATDVLGRDYEEMLTRD